MRDLIGRTLGHYRIVEKIGEGGMGVVYRAEDTTLKRQVALKVLPADFTSNQERLERFQREAETLAALDHPNIVTIHTVEEIEGVYFLTMQLVHGRPLSELIPKSGMPLERLFELAIPLADALAAAHENGVIHRDLKPANIMATSEGRLKVLDFGLAKLRKEVPPAEATELPTEPLTQEGRVVGTAPYMSPEQLEGKALDARTDIFSLGVVLYEMALGQRPFSGESSVSLISSILKETPRTVDTLRGDLPHHLGRIIAHCLEKDPKRRYQSAIDVRNELDGLRKEIESGTLSVSRESVKRHVGPSRLWWWVAGSTLAFLVAATLVGVQIFRRDREEPPTAEPPPIDSLAVLPFDNLMGDLDQDYFVDGMHEALISELAQIDALAVISRQSVLRYRDTDKTIPEIAQELGVSGVVEGSVFRADGMVRITAQLIGVIPTERHLWAKSYERDLQDVLSLQREVAQAIATQVNVTLTSAEKARFDCGRQVEPEAYDYYLRGNQYFNRGLGGPDILIAVEMYELAVARDPTFALAQAALAKAQARMVFQRYGDPTDDRAGKSLSAAERALALDPYLPEARAALGWYYYWVRGDFDRALEEFMIASKSQPHNSDLLLAIGLTRRRLGKWDQALADLLSAFELDPISNEKATEVGISYFFSRQYEKASEYFAQAIRIAPDHHRAYMEQAHTYLALDHSTDRARRVLREGASVMGREEFAKRAIGSNHATDVIWLAVDEFADELLSILSDEFGALEPMYLDYMAELHARNGRSEQQRVSADLALRILQSQEPPDYGELSRAHAILGHRQEAVRAVEEAIRQHPVADDARVNPLYFWRAARVFAMLGEDDGAIDFLENLFSMPSETSLGALATDPIWDPLHDDPRFQALLEKYEID